MTQPPLWSVVVPVKGTGAAKSRFGGSSSSRASLARAMALDVVAAAIGADGVAEVLVVTAAEAASGFAECGAIVVDDPGGGLNAAALEGIRHARQVATAVLLGDLPALTSDELSAALVSAAGHPLAFVPDADGGGTVLVAATGSRAHDLRFGSLSRRAHRAAGYAELTGSWPGLTRDVDVTGDLTGLALGPHTREWMRSVAAASAPR